MSLRSLLSLFISVLIVGTAVAQDPFERLYRSQGEGHIATTIDVMGGGFVVLSMQVDDEDERKAVNVTSFNQKGNVDWSSEYMFQDTLDILAPGEIEVTPNGNIAFSVLLDKDSLNKVITLVDPGSGSVVWSMLTGQEVEIGRVEETPSRLLASTQDVIIHTHRVLTDAGVSPIILSILDEDGSTRSNQFLQIEGGGNAHIEDMIEDIDSSILLLGSTDQDSSPIFLSKMDASGDILWNRTYDVLLGEDEDLRGMHLTQLTDSTLVIVGSLLASDTMPRALFVIQVDRDGLALKSERLQSNEPGEIFPVGIAALGTSIAIAVKNLRSDEVITNIIKYNLDSIILYESLMDTTTTELIYEGGLVSPDSVTVTYVSSSYYPEYDNLAPYLAKLGPGGETPCREPVMWFSFDSVHITQDTLSWTIVESGEVDPIEVTQRSYSFDPPLLTLSDTTYCPNDDINFLLDATTRGAVSYSWSDGSTDSTLLVTEEGMYSVTVTVGIEECFTLCDTSNITRSMFPTVMINAENQFCERGEFVLTAAPQASSGVASLEWGTGSTDNSITVTQPGDYTVMIVDNCGDGAMGEITLSQTDFSGMTELGANISSLNCEDRSLILSVGAVADLTLLSWSTGETGVQSIRVTEVGDYTATYSDEFCPGTVTFNITEDLFDVTPVPNVIEQCNTTGTAYNLSVAGPNIVRQEWFDGSTGALVSVTEPGDYTVTVFGPCDDAVTETIEVTLEEINACIAVATCLEFPNTFIPRDRMEVNRTFGPRNNCIIDEYELHVYNRWGQNIWSTTNVNERWNGTKDGDRVPGGVYFWWAKEITRGVETIHEGDVTLIR